MNIQIIKKLLLLATPMALQELLTAILQFVDMFMISRVGSTDMAAVNLASQPFFIFILTAIGITSGATIFLSQYSGKKDINGYSRTFGFALVGVLVVGTIFTLISFFKPDIILRFYSKDPQIIQPGSKYLKILAPSYIFLSLTLIISTSLKSIKKPKIPLYVTIVAIITNIILDYLLIFGKLGFPSLGIKGAALATLISRIIETMLLLTIIIYKKTLILNFSKLFSWPTDFIKHYLKKTIPVLINDLGWGTGFSLYNKIFASVGTDAITAVTVLSSVAYFFMVFFIASGHATAVLLGNQLGAGKIEECREDSKQILLFVTITSFLLGLIALSLAPYIPKLFDVPQNIEYLAFGLISIWAVALPVKAINMHTIPGILRAGGDTKAAAIFDVAGVWLIGIPAGIFAAKILGLGIIGVYGFTLSEEFIKAIAALIRVKKEKWLKVLV